MINQKNIRWNLLHFFTIQLLSAIEEKPKETIKNVAER